MDWPFSEITPLLTARPWLKDARVLFLFTFLKSKTATVQSLLAVTRVFVFEQTLILPICPLKTKEYGSGEIPIENAHPRPVRRNSCFAQISGWTNLFVVQLVLP